MMLLALGCQDPRSQGAGQTTVTSAEVPPPSQPVVVSGPDVATLVSRVSPTVVNITTTQEVVQSPLMDPFEFFFGGRRPQNRDDVVKRRGLGSGFILDGAGHVVTNAHVVKDATTVRVALADERELDAKVRGRDDRLDIAILEVTGARDLPHVALGSSEPLRVGESVVAIGNPFGLGHTVTTGIVSAKSRAIGAGPYDDFIQTDASINPGNSGGPLFNARGEVVGISTAVVPAGQGIGFAIPVDAMKQVLPQLLEKGRVSRGSLGVVIQPIDTTLAKALGLSRPRGALIADIEPGSAAAKAGIKPKDVVVAVNGVPVTHAQDLPRLVARNPPGTRVKLQLETPGSRSRTVEATLDELRDRQKENEPPKPPPQRRGDFGIELGNSPEGVIVTNADGSDSLAPGDVILEVNGTPVSNAAEAASRLKDTRTALLRVKREGRALYVAVERR